MTIRDSDLIAARDRSLAARAQFQAALNATFERLSPARLKEDAAHAASHRIDEAKAAMRQSIQRHPVALWSAVAVCAAFIFRRPLRALARAGWHSTQALRDHLGRWRQSDDG
jgi:hypothetical protein